MRTIVFEVCAESIESCFAARDGGASRIELCSALGEGGLTPSHGLIHQAVKRSGLPVYVMLRPRGGDFVYTEEEFRVMREDLLHLRESAACGVVLGLLHEDKTVDVDRTRELVRMAGALEVTFHRAFDDTPNLEQALEDVIATGCRRVLTSGGEPDVLLGVESLGRLMRQAAGRIEIAAGGGLRVQHAAELVRATGLRQFHGSMRRPVAQQMAGDDSGTNLHARAKFYVDSKDVRCMVETLMNA